MMNIKNFAVFVGIVIGCMIVYSYADEDSKYIVERYSPYQVEIHLISQKQVDEKYYFTFEVSNHYDYVLDGYLIYDIIYNDENIKKYKSRSVIEIRPVVYRGVIPVYIEGKEEKNYTITIDPKKLSLRKGDYVLNLYLTKDNANIVGNYISFDPIYDYNNFTFTIYKDYGNVPSVRVNKIESHFMGGYGQSGPLIYISELPEDYILQGRLDLEYYDIPQLPITVDIYVCEWSDVYYFGGKNKEKCSYITKYYVNSTDIKTIKVEIPSSTFKSQANQIIYLIRDGQGNINDIFESRVITDIDIVNVLYLNYFVEFKNKNVNIEYVLTGPYFPYIKNITDVNVKVCLNNICEERYVPYVYTDRISINRLTIDYSNLTLESADLCLVVEKYKTRYCKRINLSPPKASEKVKEYELEDKEKRYYKYVAVLIVFLLLALTYYIIRKFVKRG